MPHLILPDHVPPAAWLAEAATAVLVTLWLITMIVRAVSRRMSGQRLDQPLTWIAAGVATGLSAYRMWHVAADTVHLNGPARIVLFAFAELALIAEAVRARRTWRASEGASTGPDGVAVWVIAAGAGVVSALDSDNPIGALIGLSAPLLAAWLWHRGLHSDPDMPVIRKAREITSWLPVVRRTLVRLGVLAPRSGSVTDTDRRHRLDRLVRASWKLHTTTAVHETRPYRRALSRHTRAVLAASTVLDAAGREYVQTQLATLFSARNGTHPDAVGHINPWGLFRITDDEPIPYIPTVREAQDAGTLPVIPTELINGAVLPFRPPAPARRTAVMDAIEADPEADNLTIVARTGASLRTVQRARAALSRKDN